MKRREQTANLTGLRHAMAAHYRQRVAERRDRMLVGHNLRLAERWESDEPMVVHRWQLPEQYRPRASDLVEFNQMYEVDAAGQLHRVDQLRDGNGDVYYERWQEQNAEPDPRRADE